LDRGGPIDRRLSAPQSRANGSTWCPGRRQTRPVERLCSDVT
jgi:hypothetical protein